MSTFNELGERGLNAVLQARANMPGVAPSPSMMPEVGPTLALEVDRPEWGLWKGEYGIGIRLSIAGVLGEHTVVWVQPQAGQIMVIDRIALDAAQPIAIGWRTGLPFPVAWNTLRWTTMDSLAPRYFGNVFYGNSLPADSLFDGSPANPAVVSSPTAIAPAFEKPLVIRGPRQGSTFVGLMIRTVATNVSLNLSMNGYTRPETPNERLG